MKPILLDRFMGYLRTAGESHNHKPPTEKPAVTISREEGTGCSLIAERVATYLEDHFKPRQQWAIVDRDFLDRVTKDQNLPKEMQEFMEEDTPPVFKDAIETALGLHPSSEVLVRHTACTIAKLARRGNAIIVGRAANLVTATYHNIFHVRLVAPLAVRASFASQQLSLTAEEARKYVESVDRRRARYVRQFYASDIKDPSAYHLVLNTGKLGHETTACAIADAVIRFSLRQHKERVAA